MGRMLRNVSDTQRRMLVCGTDLRLCLTLHTHTISTRSEAAEAIELTVKSLMSVDFPAPFGPTTPTRLREREI